MERWFRVCTSWEEEAEADREYWLRFSPVDRVALIDTMRDEWAVLTGTPKPVRDHLQFLRSLGDRGIRALILGAHAMAFYAKPHYTTDLDLFVEATDEPRVAAALNELGFRDLGLQINITTQLAAITFDEAWRNRIAATWAGEQVFFIGKNELLRHKESSDRLTDRADAELLRRFL